MMGRIQTDILVVGGGPAGLSAAAAAAKAGARVVLLDSYTKSGGQYYRQPFGDHSRLDRTAIAGRQLIERALELGVRVVNGATVVAKAAGFTLAYRASEGIGEVAASSIVVATGAYDRVMPFPGWELPGVITAGGAQSLCKGSDRAPPGRIVLAGSGPFLMPVAASLLAKCGDLGHVFEQGRPLNWIGRLPAFLRHPSRVAELATYVALLARHRIPVSFGWRVLRAEGDKRVEQVTMARCGPDGRARAAETRTLAVDTLAVGNGFLVSSQLSSLLGCDHKFLPNQGGWAVRHDETMQSSVPGIFVAGETAGIGGVECALAEGELAGLSAASLIGRPVSGTRIATLRRERLRHRRFAELVAGLFPYRSAAYEELSDDVLICRCEEVGLREIRRALLSAGDSLASAKVLSRCGMGRCQGRICGSHLTAIASLETGSTAEQLGMLPTRWPLEPVSAGALAEWRQEPRVGGNA